jgi:hypothetical protein
VSLPTDLIAAVDRRARTLPNATRSGVMEKWLRRGARLQAEADLQDEVLDYYASLSAEEQSEDQALAHALSRSARRLEFDDKARSSARKRSR